MDHRIKLLIIFGPTASGKSRLAIKLASLFNAEIVSADSMQVYRFMDIATAKASRKDRESIPHHLTDIVYPDEDYTAARYREDAISVIQDIHCRGKNIILVGGTCLYLKVLTHGLFSGPAADTLLRSDLERLETEMGSGHLHARLKEVDPTSAENIHPNNTKRLIRALEVYYLTNIPISIHQKNHGFKDKRFDTLKIGIRKERERLYSDIENRVDMMISEGLEEETRGLLSMGYSPSLKSMRGLGYKEIIGYIEGRHSLAEAVCLIKRNTRLFAKRQMTWLKKEKDLEWHFSENIDRAAESVGGFLA